MAPSTTDTLAGSLTINMGDGIDLVDINGIKISGNVTVSGSNWGRHYDPQEIDGDR